MGAELAHLTASLVPPRPFRSPQHLASSFLIPGRLSEGHPIVHSCPYSKIKAGERDGMDKWGKQLLRTCNHTCKYIVPFGPLTNPQSWERDTTAPTLQIRKQVQKVKPSAELNSWKVKELGFESGLCDSKQEPLPYNMLPHKYYSITTNIIAIVIIIFIPYKFGKWKAETGEEDGRGTQCTQGKPG